MRAHHQWGKRTADRIEECWTWTQECRYCKALKVITQCAGEQADTFLDQNNNEWALESIPCFETEAEWEEWFCQQEGITKPGTNPTSKT